MIALNINIMQMLSLEQSALNLQLLKQKALSYLKESDKVRGYAIKTRMRPIKKKNLTQICPIWFVNG